MSANSKKSIGWSIVLMIFGLAAMYAGTGSLILLIPAATLVWYGAGPVLRGGRN